MNEDNDLGPLRAVTKVAVPFQRFVITHMLQNDKSVLYVYDNEDGSVTAYFQNHMDDPEDLTLEVITFSNILPC